MCRQFGVNKVLNKDTSENSEKGIEGENGEKCSEQTAHVVSVMADSSNEKNS